MENIHVTPEPRQLRHTSSSLPLTLRMLPGDPARLVLWRNGCLENVPRMTVAGVRLIGRCVVLHVRGTNGNTGNASPPYYYTGLVTMVTTAVISLMHVHRYTEHDFAAYRRREQRFMLVHNAPADTFSCDSAFLHEGEDNEGGEIAGSGAAAAPNEAEEVYFVADGDGVREIDSARGLASAIPHTPELADARPRYPNRHQRSSTTEGSEDDAAEMDAWLGGVSVGPLPYVSIERWHICSAFLGRDPRSSFYSLFRDPFKEVVDMQYLRMFVRQYLVHISEGNKARRVPLYAFVLARGACPMVEPELLRRVALEELEVLLMADQRRASVHRHATRRAARPTTTTAVPPLASAVEQPDVEVSLSSLLETDAAERAWRRNARESRGDAPAATAAFPLRHDADTERKRCCRFPVWRYALLGITAGLVVAAIIFLIVYFT